MLKPDIPCSLHYAAFTMQSIARITGGRRAYACTFDLEYPYSGKAIVTLCILIERGLTQNVLN